MIFSWFLAVLAAWPSLYWTPVNAGSIASWTTGQGPPQVIVQDDDTGMIFYSICNSNDTAVYPGDESRALVFDHGLGPKQDSGLTGVGYIDDQGVVMAGVWYLNTQDQLAHALFKCNETGYLVNALDKSQWTISQPGQSIHPNTGLAAVNLGRDKGYRVFYQDQETTTSAYMFTAELGWRFYGVVSHDENLLLPVAAGFTNFSSITVVVPRDDEMNIEISKLGSNETWYINSFPNTLLAYHDGPKGSTSPEQATNATKFEDFHLISGSDITLDAWDSKTQSLGLTFDSDGTARVFYIGLDSRLHCVSDKDGAACTDVNLNRFPQADSPNAPFGYTFDPSRDEIWLFYMSGGNLTQIHRSSRDKWENPIVLPQSAPPPPTPTPTPPGAQQQNELSEGALAGIGIGSSIALLSLLGLAIYITVQRKRGKAEKAKADAEAAAAINDPHPPPTDPSSVRSPTLVYNSGAGAWGLEDNKWASSPPPPSKAGSWQDRSSYQVVPSSPPLSDGAGQQQQQDRIHEMPHEVRYHEMAADSSVQGKGEAGQ